MAIGVGMVNCPVSPFQGRMGGPKEPQNTQAWDKASRRSVNGASSRAMVASLWRKFFLGYPSIGPGSLLGREGSIQVGATVAKASSRAGKKLTATSVGWDRLRAVAGFRRPSTPDRLPRLS